MRLRNHRADVGMWTNLGWWQGQQSWYEQSGNGSGIVDKQKRQRHWQTYSSNAGGRRCARTIRKRLARGAHKEWEGLPYADGPTAQTRTNEAAKVGIRSIKTYPTLWLLLFVGDRCRGVMRHSRAADARICTCMRVCVCV